MWIKAITCANGSTQLEYITKDVASSPMVSHEATIITGVIDTNNNMKL